MKLYQFPLLLCCLSACKANIHMNGTWKLISGAVITKTDTTVTDYTKDQEMIKIINDTHFAFLNHGKTYDAGGGRYTLTGDQYTEHLDFYNDKNYEGKTFTFTVTMHGDTLIQQGKELDHKIIERYVRVK